MLSVAVAISAETERIGVYHFLGTVASSAGTRVEEWRGSKNWRGRATGVM